MIAGVCPDFSAKSQARLRSRMVWGRACLALRGARCAVRPRYPQNRCMAVSVHHGMAGLSHREHPVPFTDSDGLV